MKFIFPQNYSFRPKLLGVIEYSTLFLNIIFGFFIYCISTIFSYNVSLQVGFFIILFFPIFLFSIIGFNHEKITYILRYLYFYIKSPKYYLYQKVSFYQ